MLYSKIIRTVCMFSIVIIPILFPHVLYAQNNLVADTDTFEKAKVLEVQNVRATVLAGTDTKSQTETLKVEILDGEDKGKEVVFDNDYTQLSAGDIFYARHETNPIDNMDIWSVSDPYRLNVLGVLAIVFIALIFIFGGMQGVRGLVSLCGSLLLIFYLLIPGIYNGYSAVIVSIGVSALIIIVGSYITHGFNRTTTSAVLGMIATVIITGLGAWWTVHAAHLSGFTGEGNTLLNLDVRGKIDMLGLLFGGIMIGLLGVLYDISIGQAVAIEELCSAGKHLARPEIYRRAIRIGREHIGALVNTLAIAYVGVALPLLLLMQSSTAGILFIINNEMFASEIIRILIGSIGLVLAVPITTLIATYMLHGKEIIVTHAHSH